MKQKYFMYFYDGTSITKTDFFSSVPENWMGDIKDGYYSFCYYEAFEVR